MTPPRWPLGPMRLPVQHVRLDDAIRWTNGRGKTKRRPRSTIARRQITVTQRLTPSEVATLETFYEHTLFGGALPFLWHDPIDLAARVEVDREMTFAAPPSYDVSSPAWTLATLDLTYERPIAPIDAGNGSSDASVATLVTETGDAVTTEAGERIALA